MERSEIKVTDIGRILLGEAPPEFLIEVLIRTAIIFLVLLVFLRLIGKRMGGVLTISELAVMLTMGAVLAVPMQMPDRGILQGIVILAAILLLQRGLNLWEFKSSKIEKLTQGGIVLLVKNGIIDTQSMYASRISKQQLFAELRKRNVFNLGKVKRMYLEACGVFSIYQFDEDKAGLSILPPKDQAVNELYKEEGDMMSCSNCGNTATNKTNGQCNICGNDEWVKAIV